MCALAHAFEEAGLATVALASVLGQAERSRPPRALYCDFPLGRPLGRPDDSAFQHEVLAAAFDLLQRPEGPVLESFPEAIFDGSEEPATCPLPPRLNADLHPALDEFAALRPAYDRAVARRRGRTTVQYVDVDNLSAVVASLISIVAGTPWKDAGLPVRPHDAIIDLRAYYEEAATELAGHTPAARSAEAWFFDVTEAGKLTMNARRAMKEQGAGFNTWFYMAPLTRS